MADPIDGLIVNTAVITSFTTSQGTVNTLSHAVSATGNFQRSDVGSDVRNLWARDGAEIDGVQSILNLDISTGVLNAGDNTDPERMIDVGNTGGLTANFMFEQAINSGAAGLANDFFIFENGGNDTVDIVPLNAAGLPIGDFSLTINDTDWGLLPESWSRVAEDVVPLTVSIGGVAFELSDFTGTGTLTGVHGLSIAGGAGLDPLVVGVNNALAPAPRPTLTVNRLTGEAVLSNEGTVPLDLLGYELTSEFGALNPANWLSIADEYDATSGGEVDTDDEWSELSVAIDRDDIAEFAFGGPGNAGDGGVLMPGQSIALSTANGLWFPTFNEELTGLVARTDGTKLPVTILFTGNGDAPLMRSDLDSDGDIDAADWQIVNSNYRANLDDLSLAEAYLAGDVTGDGVNDLNDFLLFVSDFDAFNGNGAFQAMLAGSAVPEPSSVALVLLAGTLIGLRRMRAIAIPAILGVLALGFANRSDAVIIAQENFESYTAVEGDPGPDFGESGENGPGGWTSAWEEHDNPISSYVRSDLLPGYGQGLEIANRQSSDSNILTRQFTAQTDDFYVGFSMRTTMDQPDGNNHTLVYFSDATTDDANDGYGGGTVRNSSPAGPGFFFTRQGDNTTHTISTNQQIYGEVYDVVFKFSKSGGATDPFEQIDMWINQATEGTPDITSNSGNASLAELSTFHVWFDPRNMSAPDQGQLALDNLVVATTYDEALSLVNGANPIFNLNALVNSTTGEVTLKNQTDGAITFKGYELVSDAVDTLDASGLTSLASQSGIHPLINPVDGDDPGSTPGDSAGEAWTVSGTPDNFAIAEQFLLGSTTLGVGESVSLGQIYDTSVGGDLSGSYIEDGVLKSLDIDFLTPTGLPGDFNDDGVVNLADYTVWRNNLGGSETALNGNGDDTGGSTGVVDGADYALWKSNFGNTAGAAAVAQTNVPEPASALLLVLGAVALALYRRAPQACLCRATKLGLLLLAAMVVMQSSQALTTVRQYTMGDNADENSADNGPVSSVHGEPFDVLDNIDSDGEFQDLDDATGAIYHQITSGDVTAGHPGAVGSFAIELAGDDDMMFTTSLNSAGDSVSQGLQMWVLPHAAGIGARQSIVFDTSNAGGPAITASGFWSQSHSGHAADNDISGAVPVVADTWHHVAQHIYLRSDVDSPQLVRNSGGWLATTSVVYVNGIATSANNDTTDTVAGEFIVGASGTALEPVNFFDGIVDELEVYTSEPNEFDLFTDNDYIAGVLIPGLPGGTLLPGDANLDGSVDATDASHFISNWRREKVLEGAHNSIYVGDWETRGWGDLDLNGRVDIDDAIILNAELVAAGAGALNFAALTGGATVPEPTTAVLAIAGLAIALVMHQNRS